MSPFLSAAHKGTLPVIGVKRTADQEALGLIPATSKSQDARNGAISQNCAVPLTHIRYERLFRNLGKV